MILMRKSHLGLGMGLGMMAGAAAVTAATTPAGPAPTTAIRLDASALGGAAG